MSLTINERARRYLAKCGESISGQGGHNAAFHAACALVQGFDLGEEDAMLLMQEWNKRCVPPWSDAELRHKVRSAALSSLPRGYLLGPPSGGRPEPRPVAPVAQAEPPKSSPAVVDPVTATERFLKGFRSAEQDLAQASPVAVDAEARLQGALLAGALYQPGELVNFVTEFKTETDRAGTVKARPMGRGRTVERDALVAEWTARGVDSGEAGGWLRMNPLDGNGVGDANVTAFRFALLESDLIPLELQLSLFAKLPLPIAAILRSGGRSVHAWVRLDARDAADYRTTVPRMLEILAKFGMDGKNRNPSRLSRLPGARRAIGAAGDGVQSLLYLNPEPEQRSIL